MQTDAGLPVRALPAGGDLVFGARLRAFSLALAFHTVPLGWLVWQAHSPVKAVATRAAPIVLELAPVPMAAKSTPRSVQVGKTREQVDKTVVRQLERPDEKAIDHIATTAQTDLVLRERPEKPPVPVIAAKQSRDEQQAAASPQMITPRTDATTTAAAAGASSVFQVVRDSWEGQVVAALEKAKRYPPAARWMGAEDVVLLRFVVARTGNVSGIRIVRSKHFEPLDDEARSLPKRVQPFPAPPASIPENPVIVTVPIRFYVERK